MLDVFETDYTQSDSHPEEFAGEVGMSRFSEARGAPSEKTQSPIADRVIN